MGRERAVAGERDVLVVAKVVGSTDFPVERPAVMGLDRESGALVRLAPFPWKGSDSDPPVPKWSWIRVEARAATYDPRPESVEPAGAIAVTAYVDARDAWRLRWPFVRPYLRPSVEEVQRLARDGLASAGFVRPAPDADVLQLPLRLRFRCDDPSCATYHELAVLDWELQEMARASRERFGARWATAFRETWGAALYERFDVRVLVSTYAQAITKPYVAGLFYPPRSPEDAHAHAHHVEHHVRHTATGAARGGQTRPASSLGTSERPVPISPGLPW